MPHRERLASLVRPEITSPIDRPALVAWYRRNRERSRLLFDLLVDDDAFYSRPIRLRHPFIFYEGHVPAFSFNTLVKTALGAPGIDPLLEALFARGIDPPTDESPERGPESDRGGWPDREVIRQFAREADARVIAALTDGDLDRPGHPMLDRAEAVFVILEHEAMHQETLHYMLQRLPWDRKRRPPASRPRVGGAAPRSEWIEIPPGRATLGVDRGSVPFAWDNECPRHAAPVDGFAIERHDVTNAAFMEFVDAGGYRDPRFWHPDDWAWVERTGIRHPLFWEEGAAGWSWRGMFEPIDLPPAWPVYASRAEAEAYARWRGARLPTEAEFQRAAYGTPAGDERRFPWGDTPPGERHGAFDFTGYDPAPAGSHPDGRSAWGVEDLVGNGWEWTSTPFGPFPGFRPRPSYPEYSADFFDGDHFVMKGASPATARDLLRPTFRNWFRRRYPYAYATFRCVKELP